MTNPERPTEPAGGLLGKLAGKAKEAAASVTGDEALAREGRLQQASVDADADAAREVDDAERVVTATQLDEERAQNELERQRLRAEVVTSEREAGAEADRVVAEQRAEQHAASELVGADAQKRSTDAAADEAAARVERERIAREQDAARLQEEALRAERRASAIDPEESA